MSSANAEIGTVLERGGTYFAREDAVVDDSDGAANDDHNYTKNNESKKEDVIISASDMKHKADICQEVIKVLKSEETIPEWELDLSDSNDSKESMHNMVIKSDTPVTDVNSNEATCSVTKHKFNLSNILPIPTNISLQRLPCSSPAQYEEQLSTASLSSICQENISMVPHCNLSKKDKSSEAKAVHQAAGSNVRGSQAHPLKEEQWVLKKSKVPKLDSQAVPEKVTPIPHLPGYVFAGHQSEPEPEEGPPSKKLKQSPYFHQPASPGQCQITRPDLAQPSPAPPVQYQVIRPVQAQQRPALVRQVRPGQPRSELARRGMGRAAPRWPAPSQMLTHSRSLPTSVSPRHPLRFPPQRFSHGGPAQFPPHRKMQRHPIHPTYSHQIHKYHAINPPGPPQSLAFSQYQYDQVTPPPNKVPLNSDASLPSHPQVRRLPPSLSVSKVSSPTMSVIPLQTLATALVGLGMQEGRKKVVQLSLTVGQIEALSTLGIKEEKDQF